MYSTMFWTETVINAAFFALGFWATTVVLKYGAGAIKTAWRSVFIPSYTLRDTPLTASGYSKVTANGPIGRGNTGKRTPKNNDDYMAYTRERERN